jgi:putrescine aminotransferase
MRAVPSHPSIEKYAKHVNPGLVKLLGVLGYGRVMVRATDVWLWDDEGTRYLDFLAGFGAANIGHNHPRLTKRLREFLTSETPNLLLTGPSIHTAELAETLADLLPAPLQVALFSNSGSEAVEAGLKLARAATRRTELISCGGGYHGTGFGALSVMGEERMRKPFEPLLQGCSRVPFGDLGALRAALARGRAAAFLLEPIQGEGGVVVPPRAYLHDAAELCRRHGTLSIVDEVQTGLGRTGAMFRFEEQGVIPDVLVLGKALGGSVAPIAATVTSREIYDKAYGSMDRFDLHGSTFAGNSFSCVAALETLAILREEDLVANSAELGGRLLERLRDRIADHPLVRDVRGTGLLIGVELGSPDPGRIGRKLQGVFGQWVSLKLLERGILCQPASNRWDVLKLEPPLTLKQEQADSFADALGEVLDEYRAMATIVKDVAKRVGRQFLRRGAF